MLKKIIYILFLCFFCLSLYAETGTVVLVNRRNYWFHYCIDPQGVDGDEDNTAEYLNSLNVKFYSIGPQSTQKIELVKEGTHYLLGFWGIVSEEQVPVLSKRFVIHNNEIIEFDLESETYQVVKKGPADDIDVVTPVVPGEIVIDNRYNDWEIIPTTALFSSSYSPLYFKKQSLTGVHNVPIKHSVFWGRGGTQINQVKLYIADDYLYIYCSSYSRLTSGLSLYLYLFKTRTAQEKNNYTIELIVDDMADTSKVVLWKRNKEEYQVIGELKNTNFFLEARIEIKKLPVPIKDIVAAYSLDLTSSYFDNKLKVYEEFYFTTIYGKDIVTKEDLDLH
jgi:hypothetical protein